MKTFLDRPYISDMGSDKEPNKNKIRLMKRKIDNLLRVIGAVLLVLSIWKPQYAPVHHAWGMLDQAYDVIELLFAGIRWLMDRIRAGK